MQFTTVLALGLTAATATVSAAPRAGAVNLDNGKRTVSTVPGGARDALAGAKRQSASCDGSIRCNNEQDQKDDASALIGKVQSTTYTAGDDDTRGVCAGSLGLFVEGDGCTASGQDLSNAYYAIQGSGCMTCGNTAGGSGGDCVIKIDFITGCDD